MFWSKLCKSTWNCAWNLAFPVFISPIVWNMCENLPYESVYFKELHNEQECYWPTIYRAGAAVVSTITSCNRRFHFFSVRAIWETLSTLEVYTDVLASKGYRAIFGKHCVLWPFSYRLALPFKIKLYYSRFYFSHATYLGAHHGK